MKRLDLTFLGTVHAFAAAPGKVTLEGTRTVEVPFAPPTVTVDLAGLTPNELRAVTDELGAQLEVTITVRRAEATARLCGALRGMENWQPTCDLPSGHEGAHRWSGPSTDQRIREIEEASRG